MSIKVNLRKKVITDKRHSLYLDFYPEITHPETGKSTRREFLGLYTYDDPTSFAEKQHNKEAMHRAEQIRFIRENCLNKPEIYSGFEKEQLRLKLKGEKNFVEFFKDLADRSPESNQGNWLSAYKFLEAYTNGEVKFEELNEKFCGRFKNHLLQVKSNRSDLAKLSKNTASSYFNKFKAALRQAYQDGYLAFDLNTRIDPIKQEETHRNFLTIEELTTLAKTESGNPRMQNAALFFALTGVRFCDIQKMKWSEIEHIEGQGYFFKFTQSKTQGVEMMPISEQAYSFLGAPQGDSDLIFNGLCNKDRYVDFPKWVKQAGITKDLTFNCLRHTFAILQLIHKTDIFTISKMLGHRSVKTTQIYAKIVDPIKREASNKIKIEI